ncbi:hypothetical protein CFB84_37720 [Burkholderia aenigmatica]|uniref:Uncharacterized protein n=1 Tax=Burkholderia aenigmatica TaxID=2015348 RepID=A0A228HU31_9BURK|nr:hypothetical protein CFB84_37720 [Burkholderia aenigmatica]
MPTTLIIANTASVVLPPTAYATRATSAMTMFPEFFSEAVEAMESGFARDGRAAGKRRRAAR